MKPSAEKLGEKWSFVVDLPFLQDFSMKCPTFSWKIRRWLIFISRIYTRIRSSCLLTSNTHEWCYTYGSMGVFVVVFYWSTIHIFIHISYTHTLCMCVYALYVRTNLVLWIKAKNSLIFFSYSTDWRICMWNVCLFIYYNNNNNWRLHEQHKERDFKYTVRKEFILRLILHKPESTIKERNFNQKPFNFYQFYT